MKPNRKKKVRKTSSQNSESSSAGSRQSSGTSPLQETALAKRRREQKEKERQKLVQEIINNEQKPTGSKYVLKDTTATFAKTPQKLEIYPTKTAPTLGEIENRLTREREHEKLKFFTVPIKMYDPDKNGKIDLSKVELSEEDRMELERYGSRVVMSRDGHVAAIEVQQELLHQFHRKQIHSEFCQCVEKEYEVSYKLQTNPKVRRIFMAKVLMLECLFRMPCLVMLHYQKQYPQLHDFIYQQNLLIFFMVAIVQGTRLAGIYFSEVGRYEPCRTIITLITMAGYCMLSVLLTSILQQFSIYFVEYKLYEDPASLETLQQKVKNMHRAGRLVSYPYVVVLMILYLNVIYMVLALILAACGKRIMNELGNGFLLVIVVVHIGVFVAMAYVIFVAKCPYFSKTPIGWDGTQQMFSFLMTTKWAMWRFYMLQQVVRGRTMKVNEHLSQFVSLNFAI